MLGPSVMYLRFHFVGRVIEVFYLFEKSGNCNAQSKHSVRILFYFFLFFYDFPFL